MSRLLPILLLLGAGAPVGACAEQASDQASEPAPEEPMSESPSESEAPLVFAVYSLSRGKGVPREARDVLEEALALVEADRARGVSVRAERTRIGLEGETRLCIEYEDPDAAAVAWREIRTRAEGVDLVNVASEPCMKKPQAE